MRYRMLDDNGDYVFGNGPGEFLVNTPEAVAQAVETRLKLWQGEWFLDTTAGMPWAQQVLGFQPQGAYDTAIQSQILNTQGVNQITSYSSSLNRATRALTVNATIDTIYGSTSLTVTL